MDSQLVDFSIPSPLTSIPSEPERASRITFDQPEPRFTSEEKGKGKQINEIDESDMEWNGSSEEGEESYREDPGVDDYAVSGGLKEQGAHWDTPKVAKDKAIARSRLGPISLPEVGSIITSANEFRTTIAAFALQKGFRSHSNRKSRLNGHGVRNITMTCSRETYRIGRYSCNWRIIGNEREDSSVEITKLHAHHNHSTKASNYSNDRKRGSDSLLSVNPGKKDKRNRNIISFPTQQEIIASAHRLIKNSSRPLKQNMNLSFATATEMRVHITAYAIQEQFAVNLGKANLQDFSLKCWRGANDQCSYRFTSELDEESNLWVNIKNESNRSSSTATSSTSRKSPPLQNEDTRQSKKSKFTPIATLPPSTSTSHLKSTEKTPSVSTGPPSQQTPLVPILPIISSPEWIISLTKLLTAIDPRLSSLAEPFEKAGIHDKEAVMEMMHFSEIGLDRLGQKMMEDGNDMTMMQKMLFTKGVIKIRGEI